ncbi:MAG: hypothetical protein NT062_37460 [Proteobacteria bacterium]|nr:hypothetical protein [Pseudomonadota bacterium]
MTVRSDVTARREPAIDQVGEPGVEGDVVGDDRRERVAPGQLDGQPIEVVGEARARGDDEAEMLGEHLDVVELDARAGGGRELDRDRGAVARPRDREVDPGGVVADARDGQGLGVERRVGQRVAHRDREDLAGGRVGGDPEPRVDLEPTVLRVAGERRATRRRQDGVAAQRRRVDHVGVERVARAVELAVQEVPQEPGVRPLGRG